jgi:hypothetical protein
MLIELSADIPPADPGRREDRATALAELICEFRHFGFSGGGAALLAAVDDLADAKLVAVERVEGECWLTWIGGQVFEADE